MCDDDNGAAGVELHMRQLCSLDHLLLAQRLVLVLCEIEYVHFAIDVTAANTVEL